MKITRKGCLRKKFVVKLIEMSRDFLVLCAHLVTEISH